ncbi:nuclear transport factor 2 family protein [Leptolyngbya sp. CCNP1308]|uniref:nuclear transport factor 2 family protein n=1 Tax=Leptolyngbya sp. CCNP1308 TaxID=3110255 RepID=UPI002B1F5782|nr:nuclear transport factor 2 family protein [Leptolyngbya sp. CCNP1308]MEA5450237.1 nuclear transport factor 2 family protein [Leptolyngbya sp. CCNP1308]
MAIRTAEAPLALRTVSSAVDGYFAGFNAEDYRAVAALFEADGVLLAPFEEPIVGPEAVYTYLQAEAVSMRATPVEVEVESDEMTSDGTRRVVVKGRVKTLLFTVSVRWTFALTAADTIQAAEIKLMASLQELVQLDRG